MEVSRGLLQWQQVLGSRRHGDIFRGDSRAIIKLAISRFACPCAIKFTSGNESEMSMHGIHPAVRCPRHQEPTVYPARDIYTRV